jgi:hypothetical protein
VGYAGKSAEEVQALLSQSFEAFEDREVPAPDTLTRRELQLAALTRGVDLDTIEFEYARIRPAPVTERVLVPEKCRTAPIIRVWRGIYYTRNVPSLDNIAEALSKAAEPADAIGETARP